MGFHNRHLQKIPGNRTLVLFPLRKIIRRAFNTIFYCHLYSYVNYTKPRIFFIDFHFFPHFNETFFISLAFREH